MVLRTVTSDPADARLNLDDKG